MLAHLPHATSFPLNFLQYKQFQPPSINQHQHVVLQIQISTVKAAWTHEDSRIEECPSKEHARARVAHAAAHILPLRTQLLFLDWKESRWRRDEKKSRGTVRGGSRLTMGKKVFLFHNPCWLAELSCHICKNLGCSPRICTASIDIRNISSTFLHQIIVRKFIFSQRHHLFYCIVCQIVKKNWNLALLT
jgi:hypothetical protein